MEQAWQFYDTVGELRFGTNWYSNALSRINIVAAAPPSRQGDEPQIIDLDEEARSGEQWYTPGQRRAVELVEFIAGGVHGQGQMMGAFGLYLSLVGLAYLVAEPNLNDPLADSYETWNVCSNEEVRVDRGTGRIEIRTGPNHWRMSHPNALIVKVWTQHPRFPWLPDAPVRGVLGILKEITLLQANIDSSATSRLSGAGLLLLPDEASPPVPPPGVVAAGGLDGDDEDLTEALVRVSQVAIQDPSSPAARIPIIVSMPGEYLGQARQLTFSTPFDDRVLDLLDKAIKRLALGMDMPPEILTGVSGMNHWSAWQVEETALTLHIEPLAETVCHALTVGYLQAALANEGFDPHEAMVWFDSSDLRTRPDRSSLAREAWDRMTISTAAMLREQGLSEDDIIDEDEKRERTLLAVARAAPVLAPELLRILGYLNDADVQKVAEARQNAPQSSGGRPEPQATELPPGPPEREDTPPEREPPEERTSLEPLIAAADVLVMRALEKAGARLLSAADASKQKHPLREMQSHERHTWRNTLEVLSTEQLLEGSFDYALHLADRYKVAQPLLKSTLYVYCFDLIEGGERHDYERLSSAVRRALDGPTRTL